MRNKSFTTSIAFIASLTAILYSIVSVAADADATPVSLGIMDILLQNSADKVSSHPMGVLFIISALIVALLLLYLSTVISRKRMTKRHKREVSELQTALTLATNTRNQLQSEVTEARNKLAWLEPEAQAEIREYLTESLAGYELVLVETTISAGETEQEEISKQPTDTVLEADAET